MKFQTFKVGTQCCLGVCFDQGTTQRISLYWNVKKNIFSHDATKCWFPTSELEANKTRFIQEYILCGIFKEN